LPTKDVNVGAAVQLIATGHLSTCALRTSGDVTCWGAGHLLGYKNTNHIGDNEVPASAGMVDVGGTVQQVTIGEGHTCVLLNRGAVRCWGAWYHGYPGVTYAGDDEHPTSLGDVPLL
jgi:hypothetical protein